MVKLVAMFSKPEDPAAFDRAYFEEHLPLNAKTPGLRRTEVTRVTGRAAGREPLVHRHRDVLRRRGLDAGRAQQPGGGRGRQAADDLRQGAGHLLHGRRPARELEPRMSAQAPGGGPGLDVEHRSGVAWLTLNRPDSLNSLDVALKEALVTALRAAADDHAVRAVALTGAGRGFCVGQDLRELRDAYNAGESPDFPALLERHYAPVIRL